MTLEADANICPKAYWLGMLVEIFDFQCWYKALAH